MPSSGLLLSERQSLLPDLNRWNEARRVEGRGYIKPFTADQQAAIDAANEMSGNKVAEKLADEAISVELDAREAFANVAPQTLADIRLQARYLHEWHWMNEMPDDILNWLGLVAKGDIV